MELSELAKRGKLRLIPSGGSFEGYVTYLAQSIWRRQVRHRRQRRRNMRISQEFLYNPRAVRLSPDGVGRSCLRYIYTPPNDDWHNAPLIVAPDGLTLLPGARQNPPTSCACSWRVLFSALKYPVRKYKHLVNTAPSRRFSDVSNR